MTLQDAITVLEDLRKNLFLFAKNIDDIRKANPVFIKDGQRDIPGACRAYPLTLKAAIKNPPSTLVQLYHRIDSINKIIEHFDYALKFIKADVRDAYLYDNGLEHIETEEQQQLSDKALVENPLHSTVLEVRNEIARVRDQLVDIYNNLTDQKQDTPTKTPEF